MGEGGEIGGREEESARDKRGGGGIRGDGREQGGIGGSRKEREGEERM